MPNENTDQSQIYNSSLIDKLLTQSHTDLDGQQVITVNNAASIACQHYTQTNVDCESLVEKLKAMKYHDGGHSDYDDTVEECIAAVNKHFADSSIDKSVTGEVPSGNAKPCVRKGAIPDTSPTTDNKDEQPPICNRHVAPGCAKFKDCCDRGYCRFDVASILECISKDCTYGSGTRNRERAKQALSLFRDKGCGYSVMGEEKAVKSSKDQANLGIAPEAADLEPRCDQPSPARSEISYNEEELGSVAESIIDLCQLHISSGKTPLRTKLCRVLRPYFAEQKPAPATESSDNDYWDKIDEVLHEASRLLDYFANGKTLFVGSGTPVGCLERLNHAMNLVEHMRKPKPVSVSIEAGEQAIAGYLPKGSPFAYPTDLMAKACAEAWGLEIQND